MKTKTVRTNHPEIGYSNNLEIVERALREQFGFDDQSHILRAVAANIWSRICGKCSDGFGEKELGAAEWGTAEVVLALTECQARLSRMVSQVNCSDRGCAISYPHYH